MKRWPDSARAKGGRSDCAQPDLTHPISRSHGVAVRAGPRNGLSTATQSTLSFDEPCLCPEAHGEPLSDLSSCELGWQPLRPYADSKVAKEALNDVPSDNDSLSFDLGHENCAPLKRFSRG